MDEIGEERSQTTGKRTILSSIETVWQHFQAVVENTMRILNEPTSGLGRRTPEKASARLAQRGCKVAHVTCLIRKLHTLTQRFSAAMHSEPFIVGIYER
jgi:hypothetical protein